MFRMSGMYTISGEESIWTSGWLPCSAMTSSEPISNSAAVVPGGTTRATSRSTSPSRKSIVPNGAPQSRVALSSMVWNTGCSSPGEREMTPSTSAVAVCCSSNSRSSFEEPRVLDSDHGLGGEVACKLDLLLGERPKLPAVNAENAGNFARLEKGHHKERAGATV